MAKQLEIVAYIEKKKKKKKVNTNNTLLTIIQTNLILRIFFYLVLSFQFFGF